jgi:hypothetical protein
MQLPGLGVVLSMTVLSAIGEISRFENAKNLVGYAGLGAGVHDSGIKHQDKGITKSGRKELRWAMVEAAWGAVRSDPHWKAQYQQLKKRGKHSNEAIVAIARKLLVAIWHMLTKGEPHRHSTEEDLAYKMLIWSQRMDSEALRGMTRQQFAKYVSCALEKVPISHALFVMVFPDALRPLTKLSSCFLTSVPPADN